MNDHEDFRSRLADPWLWVPTAIILLMIAAAIVWEEFHG
jgi:hypothetical protein